MKKYRLGAILGRLLIVAGGFLSHAAFLAAAPLTGGSFVLVGAPAAGGRAIGGNYVLTGWVASSGAGKSSGQSFDLTCGIIGVYVVNGGAVALKADLTPERKARLWWTADATGYQLEYATTLAPQAVWQSVTPQPTNNSWTTDPVQPARFFRLRKP